MNNEIKKNAKSALDKMKFEVAREIGVEFERGLQWQHHSSSGRFRRR